MRCVNRQKPNGSGRRVRGFASAPLTQHPRLCLHSLGGNSFQALVGNHETTNGETKAQRGGNECGPQGHTL